MMADIQQIGKWPWARRLIGDYLSALALLATVFLVFANTFGLDWTYDDYVVIVDNPDIRSLGNFFANHYPGRPLRELSFLLDHALFGLKPAGWHLQQLFWHGLNGVLLMLLACRLGVRSWLAVAVALLFVVHPLQVEAVANLSHRKELLLLACALLSLLIWLRQEGGSRSPWFYRGATFGCVLLAWLAKETAVLIPLLLLVAEVTLLPAERRWLTKGRRPLWLALGAILAAAWLWTKLIAASGGLHDLAFGLLNKMNIHVVSLSGYVQMVLKSWAFMALRVVWPTDLAVEYQYGAPSGWFDPWVVVALGLAIGYLLLIVWTWRAAKPLGFALCWALLLWLPVANLIPGAYLAADRYFYAPSAGLFLALGLLVEGWRWRTIAGWLLLLLVLPLSWLTWQQNAVWENNFTLFRQAVKVSPASTMALTGLGEAYLERQQPDQALPLLIRAAFNWNQPLAYLYLAQIYEARGDAIQAARWYCMVVVSGSEVPRKNVSKRKVAEYVEQKFGQRCQ